MPRLSESDYNSMNTSVLIATIDAMAKDEASGYLPPRVKVRYFVAKYGNDLIESIKGTGLFFCVAVAQNMLESTFGKSDIARLYNNFGGIKAAKGYPSVTMDTVEVKNGVRVSVRTSFTNFPNPKASFDYYVSVIKKVAPSALLLSSAEEQVLLIAKGDGSYRNNFGSPIGYTTTSPKAYLNSIQGNMNRVRDMYAIGKVS